METELRIPATYILSSECPPERFADVRRVLGFTPVDGVVVHDLKHGDLAKEFSDQVIQTRNEDDSIKLALYYFHEHRSPILVIGTAKLLDAIFETSDREAIL